MASEFAIAWERSVTRDQTAHTSAVYPNRVRNPDMPLHGERCMVKDTLSVSLGRSIDPDGWSILGRARSPDFHVLAVNYPSGSAHVALQRALYGYVLATL